MKWPARSPDLNPIENLWAIIKQELHRRYPDTKYLHGSPDTIKTILKKRLHEIWWEVFNRLIESMPERVQAVIDAEGWYTRF